MLTHDSFTQTVNILADSLQAFSPEAVLVAGIITILLARMIFGGRLHAGAVALGFTAVALGLAWVQWTSDHTIFSSALLNRTFTGMVAYDGLTVFMRLLLLGFTGLVILLSVFTGLPEREDSSDFFALLLGATVGMMLMSSANHLLMVYIAVEMASLPSYALAGFLKDRRQSSEASLKYVVYGGAASGVMLYGISLLVGRFGTGYLPDVAVSYVSAMQSAAVAGLDPALILGGLFILVGLAFKLSAVPFHFWCPDVFEGAAAEVAGFLSVASKGAAIALVGRLTLVLVGALPGTSDGSLEDWKLAAGFLGPALAFLAAITATFGNLAAYGQTNLKRLLAYSTIAHAGYMMMALATLTREGLDAALFYLIVYLFMNLGAFAVVAFIRNATGSEDLADYRGMIHRAPFLTVAMAVFLLSLVGIPPLAGYMAKFQVFASIYHSALKLNNYGLWALLVIGLLNTVISLFYYVKVLKVMIVESVEEGTGLHIPLMHRVYAIAFGVAVIVGIIFWDPLATGSGKATSSFRDIGLPADTTLIATTG